MKAVQLSRQYPRAGALAKEDYKFFGRLLKGGIGNQNLYIAPLSRDSIITCNGFAIEHHQVVVCFSGNRKAHVYVVFRAKPLEKNSVICYKYVPYMLVKRNIFGRMYPVPIMHRIYRCNSVSSSLGLAKKITVQNDAKIHYNGNEISYN